MQDGNKTDNFQYHWTVFLFVYKIIFDKQSNENRKKERILLTVSFYFTAQNVYIHNIVQHLILLYIYIIFLSLRFSIFTAAFRCFFFIIYFQLLLSLAIVILQRNILMKKRTYYYEIECLFIHSYIIDYMIRMIRLCLRYLKFNYYHFFMYNCIL